MDRRDSLKTASITALMAYGECTGLSKVFAQNPSQVNNERILRKGTSDGMEYRYLGDLDVSAIGLGCLPMVGYYGGKYDKREMIALVWILSRKPWIAPIPGTTNPDHLEMTCSVRGLFVCRLGRWNR